MADYTLADRLKANARRSEEMDKAYREMDTIITQLISDVRDRAPLYAAIMVYARARTQYVGGFDLVKEE